MTKEREWDLNPQELHSKMAPAAFVFLCVAAFLAPTFVASVHLGTLKDEVGKVQSLSSNSSTLTAINNALGEVDCVADVLTTIEDNLEDITSTARTLVSSGQSLYKKWTKCSSINFVCKIEVLVKVNKFVKTFKSDLSTMQAEVTTILESLESCWSSTS